MIIIFTHISVLLAMLLITFLVLKELVSASGLDGRWHVLGRRLNIVIVPLLITFVATFMFKIIDVLR